MPQDLDETEQITLPRWQQLLLKFFPQLALRLIANGMSIETSFEKLHEVLAKTHRIDIFPITATRGFMLVLDQNTALFFYQDHDHFKYDGFEMGEYEKGSVTIFDHIKRKKSTK